MITSGLQSSEKYLVLVRTWFSDFIQHIILIWSLTCYPLSLYYWFWILHSCFYKYGIILHLQFYLTVTNTIIDIDQTYYTSKCPFLHEVKSSRGAGSAQPCSVLWDSIDCVPPHSSVHGIFREEYCSELPFPPPGDLCNPRIELTSLASSELTGGFFTTAPPGKPYQEYCFPSKDIKRTSEQENHSSSQFCIWFRYNLDSKKK